MKSLILACALLAAGPAAAEPPLIRSQADLPQLRFKLDAKPSLAFSDEAFLRTTVPALRTAAEHALSDYRIEDPAIAQQLRSGLAAIAILQGRPADAERLIDEQRRAESKPQLQSVGNLMLEMAAAKLKAPAEGGCAAAARRLSARLTGATANVVWDEVVRRYGDVQTASVGFYAGAGAQMLDDQAQSVGSIDVLDGLYMARWRVIAEQIPPCRAELSETFRAWLAQPGNRPGDIWPAREAPPAALQSAKPVVVAVWESGFDYTLFPSQLALDPAEPLDGIDNDANGVVDDVHGPTFDGRLRPMAAPLPPLSPFLAGRFGLQLAVQKGELDLAFGEDTADSRFFAVRGREASAAEQTEDLAGASEFIAHTHGTWVASVIADGAPFVRLYNLAVFPDGADPRPLPLTEEDARRWAAMMPALGARLRGAGVRIVNMSWRFSVDVIRSRLLESGAETDPARATERARVILAVMRPALEAFIRDCPGVLFIASAGNSDQSQEIQAAIPQTFDLPNLLIVGATGANGRPTAFTSYGPTVRLYARGEAVPLRAPGGMTMKSSGTSFSGPLAARAAASMLAVNSRLVPAELIEGLVTTATTNEDRLKLLHVGHAVAWAAARKPS